MLFSDLLGALLSRPGQFAMPGADGPFGLSPPLPKAASNATGGNIPGVRGPAMANPAEMLNASTAANSAQYENTLKELQGKKLQQMLGFSNELWPSLKAEITGQGAGAGQTGSTPQAADIFGSLAPKAPSSGGGGGMGNGSGGASDPRGVVPLIKAAAEKYNVDPDTAIQVARTEGLGTFLGDGGQSGSAFQLHVTPGGAGGHVGDLFMRDTGLDPRDPKNEGAAIDYAMKHASQNGWGAWNGAKKIGITGMMGIGGARQPSAQLAQNGPMAPGSLAGGTTVPWSPGDMQQYARPGDKGGPVTVDGTTYPTTSAWNRAMDARATATAGWAAGGRQQGSAPLALGGAAPQAGASAPGQMATGGGMDLAALRQYLNQDPAMSPQQRKIIALGMGAQIAGLPDISAHMLSMYQNSPEQQGRVALQKALADYFTPGANPGLQGQIAGAKEQAKYQGPEADVALQGRLSGAKKGGEQPYALQSDYYSTLLRNAVESNKPISASPDTTVNVNPGRVPIPLPPNGLNQAPQSPPLAQGRLPSSAIPSPAGAPGQMAQAGGGQIIQGQNSAQIAAEKQRAETQGTEYGDVVKSYDAGQKALAPLTAIENAMNDFRTGPTADVKLRAERAIQDSAVYLGFDPGWAKRIAAGEIITKEGTNLGFELARTLGSREAQNIVQQAIATNPGLANSPEGNRQLISLIKQGLQRDFDKREFFDKWWDTNRNYNGAAAAFNKQSPTEAYVSKVLPFKPTSEADYNKLRPGVMYVHPDGSTRVKGSGAQP